MTENKTNNKTLLDIMEEKKRSGTAKREDVKRVKLEKPGDTVIGQYILCDTLKDNKGKPFSVYYLRTGEGRVTFSGGVTLDRVLNDTSLIGKIIAVTLVSKDTSDGPNKKPNEYEVYSLDMTPELEDLFA